MNDIDYLIERAEQELRAAVAALNLRVRDVHLELADAYSFKIREVRAPELPSETRAV